MILKYLKPFGLVLLLFSFYTSKGQNNLSNEALLAEASLLHLQKDYKNAILKLEKAFSIQKPDALNAYKAAGMYSLDENKTKALQYLNLSLDKGWTEADQLLIDPYFDFIRNNYSEEWKIIVQKAHLKEQEYEKTLKLPELRKQINAMGIEDQKVRYSKIQTSDPEKLNALQQKINELDYKNLSTAKEILRSNGWPKISQIGKDGAHNFWLIVQHSDQDILFQKKALEEMEKLKGTKELEIENYAFLYDRVQCNLNYKQVYGTQVNWTQNGEASSFRSIIKENETDKRRASLELLPLRIYALNYGFKYILPTAAIASKKDQKDKEDTLSLINSAKKYYESKEFQNVYENYNNASMILGGMTSAQNFEAAELFAKIYNQTNEEQYRSIALDFLSLNHLRGDLNLKSLLSNAAFQKFYSENRWKDIVGSL
ncbi:hypothetical protein BB050_04176 [Flavobacterium anhuiense]|uniref:Uncharacterized protein n=1 Tax=Flavobacterium anhuiense TaxID=459526 RepID=A0AAC9D640_9FLAO|nr:DUF6624 domain-containing protein [Flavobacterium anhuiense]AOC97254.1 hypothetical protein BB050_04176 [Flavobacterium anhuiense]SCY52187.1 hypothetical protein SAMN02927916_2403 [Flavobacterium anhuiense]